MHGEVLCAWGGELQEWRDTLSVDNCFMVASFQPHTYSPCIPPCSLLQHIFALPLLLPLHPPGRCCSDDEPYLMYIAFTLFLLTDVSLLSVVLPATMLLYALLAQHKSYMYWQFALVYLELLLIAQYTFQAGPTHPAVHICHILGSS